MQVNVNVKVNLCTELNDDSHPGLQMACQSQKCYEIRGKTGLLFIRHCTILACHFKCRCSQVPVVISISVLPKQPGHAVCIQLWQNSESLLKQKKTNPVRAQSRLPDECILLNPEKVVSFFPPFMAPCCVSHHPVTCSSFGATQGISNTPAAFIMNMWLLSLGHNLA